MRSRPFTAAARRVEAASIPGRRSGSWRWFTSGRRNRRAASESAIPRRARRSAARGWRSRAAARASASARGAGGRVQRARGITGGLYGPGGTMVIPMILRLTLGTAGHIDHGKTSLVRALVGGEADTDRLKEERARGLTIEIGYAEWKLADGTEVGIVDVPGHEKFVRNMVAGATGMDCVLLVVAADDGAMPQTREHLQIITLLGMRVGAVAVTKIDLVDPEMRELVVEDVRALLAGTFLEGAPLFPVSSTTGEGIPELRAGLEAVLRAIPPRDATGPFRMPVQRVFTVKGHGTVATGIPVSGTVARDDRLELLPGARSCRVRGIQVY